ncbi:MAG: 50S ribosome-binding GTPase [Planctomycetes bacterium]|nr:50S ribosome-binding GTPase [Planctomycetota bacterium]
MSTPRDTIVAIASPPGAALRGIVRASGPLAAELVRRTTDFDPAGVDRAWRAARFDDGEGAQPALVTWMRGPRSFTGEDVAEFHLLGNPHLLAVALARCVSLGARPAAPGEFTRRAFLAGKLDLSRAEGVLLLVSAQNDAERRAGAALLFGGLARAVGEVRDALVEARALCEASLDFDPAETGHVPEVELRACFARARARLAAAEEDALARPGELGVPRVVLAGAPNAGKSQLFNALVARSGRAATEALVAPLAGTTRDVLTARIVAGGVEAELVDTAGEAPARDALETEAQRRARASRSAADVLLWVVDAAGPELPAEPPFQADADRAEPAPVVLAWNQLDRREARPAPPADWARAPRLAAVVGVSGRTGAGLEELLLRLGEPLLARRPGVSRELAARHQAGLARARLELERAEAGLGAGTPLELVAEHLRSATAALDELDGATTSEDVLDRIFARFCLGK